MIVEDPKIRKIPFFFGKPNLTEMNRIYNELCKVIVSDIPVVTMENLSPQLVTRVSISNTYIQEEITIKEDSIQSNQDDYCMVAG